MSALRSERVAASSLALTLYGRERELAHVHDLVDRVGERGGSLVIRGDAGIGKSALLTEARARARMQGTAILETTGVESEARLAFAGLHHLLRPFLGAVEHLPLPQRRAVESAFGVVDGVTQDIFLIALAALDLIAELAAKTPLLLVVEDAHWLDRPTCEVLAFVARRVEMEPVVVLLCVREGLASGVDDAALPELQLEGLAEDAAGALLDAHAPALSAELRSRILKEAAGNPLALLELPVALVGRDVERLGLDPLPLTVRLERAFADRLSDLDAHSRLLLFLAALDDVGDSSEVLAAAELIHGDAVGIEAFSPAVTAGLGTLETDGFHFRHPLIRSAVQQAATVLERRSAHTALAEVLEAKPDRRVWHRAAAAAAADDDVALELEAAADRARRQGGGDVAVAALQRAAELSEADAQKAGRLLAAAELAFELGRRSEAIRILQNVQQLELTQNARTKVSYLLEELNQNGWSGAASVRGFVRIADELLDRGETDSALDALHSVAVRSFWSNLDEDTRQLVVAAGDRLPVPADDPTRLTVFAHADPVGHGGDVLARIARLDPVAITDAKELLAAGTAAAAVWADSLAAPFLAAAVVGLRAEGRLGLLAQALVFQAWGEIRLGDTLFAATAAAEAARLAEETGQIRYAVAGKLAQAVTEADRGSEPRAEGLVAEAEGVLLPMGATPMLAIVEYVRGRIALARERYTEAYEHISRIFDRDDVAYMPFVGGCALADLVDAAARGGGALDAVRTFSREWEAVATATDAPHLQVQLSYTRAVLAGDTEAEPLFRAALAAAASGWPAYRGRTLLAYGGWLRRQRRAAESRRPLREAASTFDALGLVRLAERARRELRASGETTRRRVLQAWDQLTPQEFQIARLAADGLTNREIGERLYLSHRTVGSHLYRLFPKLGITSRGELAAALELRMPT